MHVPQQFREPDLTLKNQWSEPGTTPDLVSAAGHREDSDRLQSAVAHHPSMTFLHLDLEGQVTNWNPAAEKLLGYTASEAMGKHLSTFFLSGVISPKKTKELLKTAATKGQACLHAEAKPKTGRSFRAETEITPLSHDTAGPKQELVGFSLFFRKTGDESERLNSRPNELQFEKLVNSAPVFIWTADADAYVTYANQTWQDFTGKPFEGALGHAYRAILHPDDLQATLEQYEKAVQTQQPFELECRMRRQDGAFRWIHYQGVPQYAVNGDFDGFMGVGMDITERKDMKLALVESEYRFRSLTDDIPVMIWMADADTRITHANKACCEFLGQTLSETIGQTSNIVTHPDDLPLVEAVYKTAVRNHEPYKLECRVKRWDGEYRWFLFRGVPRFLPDKTFLGFIGIGFDITERKNAELAISESEIRFRAMADASPIMIWLMDDSNNLIYANKALLDFYGQPLEAIVNLGWEPYIDPADLKNIHVVLADAIKNRSIYEFEMQKKRADGQYRWVLVRGAPRFQQDGTYVGIVGSSLDITEIRQARELLEIQVKERTLQLETANKELEAFAYSVSHDLRAPLRSIGGFSTMLLNKAADKLDSNERRYLHNVCENAQRMGELIDDMLKLSRLSRAEMVYADVDLSQMAREILYSYQTLEPQRHVETKIAEGMVAHGDANLIRVVLENLLGNAWKYTSKKEEARIEVGFQLEGDRPVYFVRDNGAGFNMKYAGKLFGAFQRLHRIDEFPGTGIGLATVARIMHRHGGRVWAEADVNQGATFYFSFF